MDRDTAKEEILQREPTFLMQARRKVGGYNTFICPVCGKGTWKNYAGISRYINKNGKVKYHCFGCGLDEDIVGLWKTDTGIEDNREVFNGLYEYYGIQVDGREAPAPKQHTHSSIHTPTCTPEPEEPETDYTDFFLQANKNLDKTTYHRGITLETLNKFKVGYVESWIHPKAKKPVPSPRLIIPTSRYSYLARDTRENLTEEQKDFSKPKVGKVRLFNSSVLWKAQKPIFVVEGEIDALSIIDVGGDALGLGSIAYRKKLPELIKAKGEKPVQPLILALDNDKGSETNAGQEAEEDLAGMLEAEGISYYRLNIYPTGKDANEGLQASREAFTKTIREAEEQVIKAERDKTEMGAEEEKKEEQTTDPEKEAYLKTSTVNYLQDFVNGIADSVNTPYIPTGFSRLDTILDGGLFEGLYIIGAVSSLGKTTLITQMGDQIAEQGEDVLIFSLEMSRAELMSKSISRLTLKDVMQNNGDKRNAKTARGITTGVRYAHYSKEEIDLISRATEAYGLYAGNVYIQEGMGDIGAEQVRETVKKHISFTGKRPVVIVDYIQMLAPADVRATDKQNMDKAILELKRISRDFKLPVIGISSFNRENYRNEVTMEAFKESGSIEYSSDVLIGLQYNGAGGKDFDVKKAMTKDPREVELVVLKNRNGSTGKKVELNYYPLFNYFVEA